MEFIFLIFLFQIFSIDPTVTEEEEHLVSDSIFKDFPRRLSFTPLFPVSTVTVASTVTTTVATVLPNCTTATCCRYYCISPNVCMGTTLCAPGAVGVTPTAGARRCLLDSNPNCMPTQCNPTVCTTPCELLLDIGADATLCN